jgi:hypothetical protein
VRLVPAINSAEPSATIAATSPASAPSAVAHRVEILCAATHEVRARALDGSDFVDHAPQIGFCLRQKRVP